MSKKEKIQTKINIYCIYLATALASFVAIVGFIFTSFASLPVWLCGLCGGSCDSSSDNSLYTATLKQLLR
ncbi:MAG: hypothetical protein MR878_06570 [Campylobacter sp.]|uniref:hypothetical protein n=1 Tax=Campylobacter sp. TaxID=205 RepID=UPI002AA684DF|nr:hypothetical protein [Campylobacter sp.]MCI7015022.1 hypothetical protein [Campylobacter sp.]